MPEREWMFKDCTNLLGIAMGSSEAVGFIDMRRVG